MKGWKKVKDGTDAIKKSLNEMMKEKYEAQAGEIRKNISIAKAEMKKTKANQKLTNKGKKNRVKLMRNCKSLSIADLVDSIEREKSKLR